MSQRSVHPLGTLILMATLTLLGCGGSDSGQVSLQIDTSASGLLGADLRSAIVVLYAGEPSCAVVRFSGARVPGVYQSSISLAEPVPQSEDTNFNTLVPDTYRVAAWGYNGAGEVVAFGCAQALVEISENEVSQANLSMGPFSP